MTSHTTSSGIQIDITQDGAIRIALDARADYLELQDVSWRELITAGYALICMGDSGDSFGSVAA